MKLNNPEMLVCIASMGKMFRVRAIAKTDDEANELCRKNKDLAVIATDNNGLVYLADQYSKTIPSQLVKDFIN